MSGGGAESGCSYILRHAGGRAFGAAIPDAAGGPLLLTADMPGDLGTLSLSLWLRGADGKPVAMAALELPAGCLGGLEHFLRSARAHPLVDGAVS